MKESATLERCLSYVELQLGPHRPTHPTTPARPPTVTLSRQTGTGGLAVAKELADFLQANRPGSPAPWTVFDRALVEKVLAQLNLPARFAKYMPEDRVSYLQDALEELLGLHPPQTDLVTQTTQTILGLAELGNCVIVGRAAHVILAGAPSVVHVRLVGSMQRRIARIMATRGLTAAAAARYIEDEDAARARYLRAHFDASADDPLAYHLVLNTDHFPAAESARIIGHLVLDRLPAPA